MKNLEIIKIFSLIILTIVLIIEPRMGNMFWAHSASSWCPLLDPHLNHTALKKWLERPAYLRYLKLRLFWVCGSMDMLCGIGETPFWLRCLCKVAIPRSRVRRIHHLWFKHLTGRRKGSGFWRYTLELSCGMPEGAWGVGHVLEECKFE